MKKISYYSRYSTLITIDRFCKFCYYRKINDCDGWAVPIFYVEDWQKSPRCVQFDEKIYFNQGFRTSRYMDIHPFCTHILWFDNWSLLSNGAEKPFDKENESILAAIV